MLCVLLLIHESLCLGDSRRTLTASNCPSTPNTRLEVTSNMNIEECSFSNMHDSTSAMQGGAIHVKENLEVTITKTNFTDIKIDGKFASGGAIYSYKSKVSYSYCNFQNCSCIFIGGAITNEKCTKTVIEFCSFVKCHANSASACKIHYEQTDTPLRDTVDLKNCTFDQCYHETSGDTDEFCTLALDFDGDATITQANVLGCTFKDLKEFAILCEASMFSLNDTVFEAVVNEQQDHSACVHCLLKSISTGQFFIVRTNFISCETQDYGMMNVPNVALHMEDCLIQKCKSNDKDNVNAHGFMITDNDNTPEICLLLNVNFIDNQCNNEGAGLFVNRVNIILTLDHCNFINNHIVNNNATNYGASFHFKSSGTLVVNHTKFTFLKENDATSVVIENKPTVSISNSCFNSSGTYSKSYYHIISSVAIKFEATCFTKMGDESFKFTDDQDWNGIFTDCEDCKPFDDCPDTSIRNEFKGEGNQLLNVRLQYCSFFDLISAEEMLLGGALSLMGCDSLLHSCKFTKIYCNGAKSQGGAVYTVGCIMKYQKCTFIDCKSGLMGGANYNESPQKCDMIGCTFQYCFSRNASAVKINYRDSRSADTFPPSNFEKCTFKNCNMSGVEPEEKDYFCTLAIDLLGYSTDAIVSASLNSCIFQDIEEFAVLSEVSNFEIIGTVFTNVKNPIEGHASCIHCLLSTINSGNYRMINTTFDQCNTKDYGVMNIPFVNLSMKECKVNKCFSTDSDKGVDAHGIMITDEKTGGNDYIEIINCEFVDNTAGNGGAGIFMDRPGKMVSIYNCLFKGNAVRTPNKQYGISLHCEKDGSIDLIGCIFQIDKVFYNKGSSNLKFADLTKITMQRCSLIASGFDNYTFHIVSNTKIDFIDYNCYTKMTSFPSGSDEKINFDVKDLGTNLGKLLTDVCSDNVPTDECKKGERYEYTTDFLHLNTCNFTDFTQANEKTKGGVIYVQPANVETLGILIIKHCFFINVANTGNECDGGCIYSAFCNVSIVDTLFSQCESKRYAGAIFNDLPIATEIIDSTFDTCQAEFCSAIKNMFNSRRGMAQGITLLKKVKITNCISTFTGESDYRCALSLDFAAEGVELEINSTLIDVHFETITSQFAILSECKYMTIVGCSFLNCKCNVQNRAACIYCLEGSIEKGNYFIHDVTFIRCTSDDFGVMNVPNVKLDMQNCVFKYNYAMDGDTHMNAHGLMITDSDDVMLPVYLNNVTFDGNTQGNGGALYIDRKVKNITMKNCEFSGNVVPDGQRNDGVSLLISGDEAKGYAYIYNCAFKIRKTGNSPNIAIFGLETCIIYQCCFATETIGTISSVGHISTNVKISFYPNNCFNDLGEHNFDFQGEQPVLENINFNCDSTCVPITECPSERLEASNKLVNVIFCRFDNYRSDKLSGGALCVIDGNVKISDCVFIYCEAKNGGAVYLENSPVLVERTSFIGCTALQEAGAIYLQQPNTTFFDNVVFGMCSSPAISALKVNAIADFDPDNDFDEIPQVTIFSNCKFQNNEVPTDTASWSQEDHCALSLVFDSSFTVLNTTIIDTIFESNDCFGIYCLASYLTLKNTLFNKCNNKNTQNCASCVYCDLNVIHFGKYIIDNTNFTDCETNDYGVMNVPNVELSMTNSLVKNCISHDTDRNMSAHGFMITDDDHTLYPVAIENCIFDSTTNENGGALFIDRKYKEISIIRCDFKYNSVSTRNDDSKLYGANLMIQGEEQGKVILNFCKFYYKKANDASSVYFDLTENTRVSMSQCCFKSQTVQGKKYKTAFNIFTKVPIFINDFVCMVNNSKYGPNNVGDGINEASINYNCDNECVPKEECKKAREEYESSKFNINGCTYENIEGSSTSSEGGLFKATRCYVIMNGCEFRNINVDLSEATNSGGAIYLGGCVSVIQDCTFLSCKAPVGGALAIIYPLSSIIKNSKFLENMAVKSSAIQLKHSSFSFGSTKSFDWYPDGTEKSDTYQFIDTVFHDNKINSNDDSAENSDYSCVLSIDWEGDEGFANFSAVIDKCLFEGGSGSFGVLCESGYLQLTDTNFSSIMNKYQGHSSCVHSLVGSVSTGKYVIHNVKFTNCNTEDFGVMNIPCVEVDMRDCTLEYCSSVDGDNKSEGHGLMVTDSDLKTLQVNISNVIFRKMSMISGGALFIDRALKDVRVENCLFDFNSVTSERECGANIHIVGTENVGKLYLKGCRFNYEKTAKVSSIYIGQKNTVEFEFKLEKCCFNTKVTDTSDNTPCHIYSDCSIVLGHDNCFNRQGSMFNDIPGFDKNNPLLNYDCDSDCIPETECKDAYEEKGVRLNLHNCSFRNINVDFDHRVPVYIERGVLYTKFCTFSNIAGNNDGGSIYSEECENHIRNTRFIKCNSSLSGGAILIRKTNYTYINECSFSRCSSIRGSACWVDIVPDKTQGEDSSKNPKNVTITGCQFKDCVNLNAKFPGDDAYYCTLAVDFDSRFTIADFILTECSFTDNKGFGVLSEASYMTIKNVYFHNIKNEQQGHASCVHCLTESVMFGSYILNNVTFSRCDTQDFGVMNVPNVALDMRKCTVSYCNSLDSDEHKNAHGFMITDIDFQLFKCYVIDCLFEYNEGSNGGAGLYIDRQSKDVTIDNCVFNYNKASYDKESKNYGANLQVLYDGRVMISNCKFSYTKRNDACSVLFKASTSIIMSNNCFQSSASWGTYKSAVHLTSDFPITINSVQCFNNITSAPMFQLSAEQDYTFIFTNCDEYCKPKSECPKPGERVDSTESYVLNLYKCNFENFYYTGDYSVNEGGGVIFLTYTELVLRKCSFSNNTATQADGGAIFLYSSSLTMIDTNFNKCKSGSQCGALINNFPTMTTLDNVVFDNCDANKISAGKITFSGTWMSTSTVILNKVQVLNTDVNINSFGTDYDCCFAIDYFNDFVDGDDDENDGDLYEPINATLIDCEFNNNQRFALLLETSHLTMIRTVFQGILYNNEKQQDHSSCIHVITKTINRGQYDLKNCSFISCLTNDYGVMNFPAVALNMDNCVMRRCQSTDKQATNGHGISITDDDANSELVLITRCEFVSTLTISGGTVFIDRKFKFITFQDCKFMSNAVVTTNTNKMGGNIMSTGQGDITLLRCEFNYEASNNIPSNCFQGLSKLVIEGCCFNARTSGDKTDNGVHLYSDNNRVVFLENNCYTEAENAFVIVDLETLPGPPYLNTNCRNCQPVYECQNYTASRNIVETTAYFYQCIFQAITLPEGIGGAINAKKSIVKIENCMFNNIRAYSGACAYLEECEIKVIDCTVSTTETRTSGAFSILFPNLVLFYNSNFSYCKAATCAAISIDFKEDDDPDNDNEEVPQSANLTKCSFKDCTLTDNTDDDDYRCAIGLDAQGITTVIEAYFINVTIQNIDMFGVLSEMSFLTIKDSIFDNIRAKMQGHASAVHCLSQTVHFGEYILSNVSFTSCLTQDFGVMNVPNVYLSMDNCVVKDCFSYDDDEHTRAHGFMITDDDDLLLQILISNCLFQSNEAANGGAGLYIDRRDKDIKMSQCIFKYNQATYNEDSDKYGANLQVTQSGSVNLYKCEFYFDKINKASSVRFDLLDQIIMSYCCFKSTGENVENSIYHIVSTTEIFFKGYSCFNDMKNLNFAFTRGQDQENIAFNCKDLCIPTDECPTKRVELSGQNILYQCTFENIATTTAGQSGGVIKGFSVDILIDSCLFTRIKATGKDASGGAIQTDFSINEIRNCKFIKCEAAYYGGALSIKVPFKAVLTNNIFSYCVSKRTSAVHIEYNTAGANNNAFIDSCTFKDCTCKNIDYPEYYCSLSMDFPQARTIVNASITNCIFVDLKTFAVLMEASYLNLTNTLFQNCVCDKQNYCSCVHVQINSIRDGQYIIHNTSFVDCKTGDFGTINVPNVQLDMRDCQVLRCTSLDSDYHEDAHGVMLTDFDGSIAHSYIVNCVFQENVAGNAGAGLFINRKSIRITIESCKFIKNQATYAKDSAKYGVNLHIQPFDPESGYEFPNIWINFCKFVFDKENSASNIMILNKNAILNIESSCFTSNGEGDTPYHIVSNVYIGFQGTNCFNDKGKNNFQFAVEEPNETFHFDCAENCIPRNECPMFQRFPNQEDVTVNLVSCAFISHSIFNETKDGGALNLKNCILYLTDCTFQKCTASEGRGGAIYASNTIMNVVQTKFTLCECNSYGGAINCVLPPAGIKFEDCYFVRCKAHKVSSIKVEVPSYDNNNNLLTDPFVATLINCIFKENYASDKGNYYCSVYVECRKDIPIDTVMKGCKFLNMNNFGMYSENSYFILADTIFENLNATSNTDLASCVHCRTIDVSYGEYTILNTTFIKCSSDDFGVMNVPNVGLKMKNVLVKDCTAFDNDQHLDAHGFMITDDDNQMFPVIIEDCIFENNDGANGGGGLYIDRKRKDVTIYNCQFLNNEASYNPNSKDYGCNLQVVGIGKINLTKCKFVSSKKYDNDASSIKFDNLTKITINNCCFKASGGKQNSPYYIISNTNISFVGVQCVTNKTGQNQILFSFAEGQIPPVIDTKCDDFCIQNVTCPATRTSNEKLLVNIDNCRFSGLETQGLGNGGAIYCSSCVVYIRDSNFQDCRTTSMSSSGGAIYLIRSEMHLITTNIVACKAFTYGGAVESVFPNVTEIQSCQFVRCTAMRASALHINVMPDENEDDDEFEVPQVATIIGCTFRDNYHIKSTGEGYEDYYCSVSVDFSMEFTNLNSTFKDTQFIDSKEFAILSEATTLHMENVVFRGITNDVQGHASCVHCLPESVHLGTYVIKNTSFIDCLTEDFGVMNVPNVGLNMTDCVVLRCNSTDSDKHTEAHGFMITDDDDLLFPVYIYNCVFESNDGANGGAGLYIDRKQKNIIIEHCKFFNNQASYNANSANYGVNLQVIGSGKIHLTKCKFIYTKMNNAVNVRFQGLDDVILNNNCFISNGIGNTPFHIYSNTIITFEGSQHCFNQKGNYNFELPADQKIPDTVKFTCDEHCVPADTCPTKQAVSSKAVVNIFKCNFNGIKTLMANGGVINSMDGIVNIIESTFTDCSSKLSGGAVYIMSGEAHIVKDSFTNCVADSYTGGIYLQEPNYTDIQGCSFTNCQSKRVSALYVSFVPDHETGNDDDEIPQYASIANCQFSKCKNTKVENYYLDYYCTVSLDFQDVATVVNATVLDCSFTDNTGFGILSELTYFQLINTVFTKQNNDKAQNHSSCVHCLTETVHFGEYTIINSSFIECSTDDYGVMNVPNVKLTLKDSLVSKCKSTDSDTHINAHGFMITDDDDSLEKIHITNCVFSENDCANGGALFINRKLKDISIDSCTFSNNKATFNDNSDKYGANLQVEGTGKVIVAGCKFEFDKANKATSVRFEGLDSIQMEKCCFNTKASSKDGYFNIWADKRIAFTDYMCFNSIEGVSNDKLNHFVDNQYTETFSYNCDEHCIPISECPTGPKSRARGETVNLKGCNFVDFQPGVIQTLMGTLYIRDTVFKPKQTSERPVPASAIISRNTDIYVYNTVFEKCVYGSEAGAIKTYLSNITVFEGCRFSECANKYVSAIHLDMIPDSDATNDMYEAHKLANFTGCTFTKCSHPDYDPEKAKFYCTLAVNTGSVVTVVELNLISCTFEDIQGFGVLSTASFMTMKDTTFKNITHDKQDFASCVHVPPDYVHFGTYTITNTKFLNCVTEDYGVMNVPNVGLHMISCTISNCVALDSDQSINGHGFMITDTDDLLYPVVINSCTFEGNDGANGGAGLYIDRSQKDIFISNCQFKGNKASHNANSKFYGVNVQVVGTGKIKMSKCQFDYQKTNEASSVLFKNLDHIIIDSCNFNSEGVSGSPYHIVADTLITFEGVSCLNNKGEFNFKFADGQATTGISFTCSGGGSGDDSQNQGSGSGVSPGGMAGIIIAVVAIIAIAAVAVIVFMIKKGTFGRKEDSEVYHADKEVSYSEAMSTATFETANAEHVFDDEL